MYSLEAIDFRSVSPLSSFWSGLSNTYVILLNLISLGSFMSCFSSFRSTSANPSSLSLSLARYISENTELSFSNVSTAISILKCARTRCACSFIIERLSLFLYMSSG